MKQFLGLAAFSDILLVGSMVALSLPAKAESPLTIVYPPPEHQTVAEKIFFIGTAPPDAPVFINGKKIKHRSPAGHFAPSLPLKPGSNSFEISYDDEQIELKVIRNRLQPKIPESLAFAPNSLSPNLDLARMPDEPICFGAIAPENSTVSVKIGRSKIVLLPQVESIELPTNAAVLTDANNPARETQIGQYQGCTTLDVPRNYGKPIFELEQNEQTITQQGTGEITILSPKDIQVVEVTAQEGVARTGASSDHSRLTPLPKGTRARVTGQEGEWLRLDYGGWLKESETQPVMGNIPPQSIIRGIIAQQKPTATEIVFPLQTPVPVAIKQQDNSLTLSLHNTTAQTDTIRLDSDPLIKRLDWQQVSPTQIDYTFELNQDQQWGYDLRYEDTSLILSLRHPPKRAIVPVAGSMRYGNDGLIEGKVITNEIENPLQNITILLDPGHGGEESGAKGPTGYAEKEINLVMAKLVEQELIQLGAKVYLTREKDRDVSLEKRIEMINRIQPDLAISIHYNALPDNGDAEKTQGISTFWYHTQAHSPAVFLHNYLVTKLDRPDAGTFWNNLALTRPHTAPSVLLELGYMINPQEFEWITNQLEQRKLANAIAQGIKEWFGNTDL